PSLVTDPDALRTIISKAIDDSIGYGRYWNKPVSLKNGNPVLCSDPYLPPIILKEGLHHISWQSTVGDFPNRSHRVRSGCRGKAADRRATAEATQLLTPIHRYLPVVPSVETLRSTQPKTAIPGRQNGKHSVTR